ncbi:DUF7673 family protein [Marinimicrobium sp. ARAG 43.8]|uniref:DUF7673 family protein n=1 Tax=Marinimicrobium sp. ARAG 43.8 TaxID=3418719 RepID=UPI003CEABCCA
MQPTHHPLDRPPVFTGIDPDPHQDSMTIHLGESLTSNVLKQCTQAVRELVALALKDCGGSQAAAEVLLGTYNGRSYPMNLTELCRLDDRYYKAAVTVIHLRCRLNTEPHQLLANGDSIFQKLAQEWEHLRVQH